MDLARRRFLGLLGGAAASIIVPPAPKSYFFFGNIFRPKKELSFEWSSEDISPEDIQKLAGSDTLFVVVGKVILQNGLEPEYSFFNLKENP